MVTALPAIVLSLLLASALGVLAWQFHRGRVLSRHLESARMREGDLVRLTRMTASDLRGPALGLLGSAEQAPAELKQALVGVCRFLLDLAEALLDQTEEPGASRNIHVESVRLGPLLDFVVAQVAAQLGAGRRAWRLAEGLNTVTLMADRRALHQVLLRVITGAALSTGDGDGIEITAMTRGPNWVLVVEDEGAGLALGKTANGGVETRGLGVGLALARQLMHAHGGELAMESTARVGTRALISLPVARLLDATQT